MFSQQKSAKIVMGSDWRVDLKALFIAYYDCLIVKK